VTTTSRRSRRRLLGTALAGLAATLCGRSPVLAGAEPAVPARLRIPAIGVDAPVEVRTTVGTDMQDPTGPWVVAWYDDSARPGAGGNAVFAGHLDYPGVGPAAFARLGDLGRGDEVVVRGDDGAVERYRVVWSRAYPAVGGPWVELTGPTPGEVATLITCDGPWDADRGTYRDRLVVRAARVDDDPADVPAHPRA
jgi:LPXTG-site transpeptidase (sortase) family protein